MAKLLLLSFLGATIALPALAARDPSPRRGLRTMWLAMLAFGLLYLPVVIHATPRPEGP